MTARPRKGRILLIDDSQLVLDVIAVQLEQLGYTVERAQSGFIGLESFFSANFDPARRFDVVITDISMPDFNGMDVLANIRSRSPETAVIVLSQSSHMSQVREAMRQGAADYVIKDEGIEPLQKAIER